MGGSLPGIPRGDQVGILNDLLLVLLTKKEVCLMGITYIEGVVSGPTGKQARGRFLVDSGVTYTLLPHDDWRAIELSQGRRS